MALNKDLVAASATPVILAILRQGDSYGYDIIRQVREVSDGKMEWADGMLYPILHRMEKKKLISSYWGESEARRRRKYYKISEAGCAELIEHRQNLQEVANVLQLLDGGSLCLT
jgi:PadR family transcriptional regulator, regulatory protein PadR